MHMMGGARRRRFPYSLWMLLYAHNLCSNLDGADSTNSLVPLCQINTFVLGFATAQSRLDDNPILGPYDNVPLANFFYFF